MSAIPNWVNSFRKILSEMKQESITQRVKFLSETLAESVRAFGIAVGEKQTTTSNYITGRNKPSSDFLEKIVFRFRNVNAHWLLTGEGDPFKEGSAPAQNQATSSGKKSTGAGTTTNYNLTDCEKERDGYRSQLDLAQAENQSLRDQLARADALIAAKDEMLDLLRSGFNRSN